MMSTMRRKSFLFTLFLLLMPATLVFAQSGKVAGTVTDAETGNPIPGVNVVIEETTFGATTNADGQYTILNVSPGNYNMRASFVGYADQIKEGVDVNIDLTTEVDFALQESTQQLQEVTVQAQEEVVKKDVSASVANLSADQVENLPVTSIEGLIGLQAGVRGLSVRGGNASSLQFRVDGVRQFDGRQNRPFTGVSYTAIEEVQIQTGGFNAEYGNLRSGLINVSLKDGPRNRYTFDILTRYSPAHQPYSGPVMPTDGDAYYIRPFIDDPDIPNDQDPAYIGTENRSSTWDQYDREAYPTWKGWNAYAQGTDLSPEQWQEVFRHYYRKDFEIDQPEYTIDGSFGGPVPLVSDPLGDLRFFASYRQTQEPYQIPMERDRRMDRLGRLKLTSNVGAGLQVEVMGMLNRETGHVSDRFGSGASPFMFSGGSNIVGENLTHVGGYQFMFFSDNAYSLMNIDRNVFGAELTHTLGSNTFYEFKVNRTRSDFETGPGPLRDTSTVVQTIGGLGLNEAPFGYGPNTLTATSPSGMALGRVYQQAYDTSWARQWNAEFDLTSQLNQYVQVKTGADFLHQENKRESWFSPGVVGPNGIEDWNRSVILGAAYAQSKLEFEGLIANVGVRLDYLDPQGEWYAFSPFDSAFGQSEGTLEERFGARSAGSKFALSPRIGVSFPITANSKLFFNYGHFRELMDAATIFEVDEVGTVGQMGNPYHPLPRTVSYEIGFEQNLFNQFLLRLSGYYKDLADQPQSTGFISGAKNVNYDIDLPFSYEDVRGFEASVSRVTGWVRGFVNFTYMARKGGRFGWPNYQENVVSRRQYRNDQRNTVFDPVPRPYANVNLEFIAPPEFGPQVAGVEPLGDWRLSLLGRWRQGQSVSYCGGQGCPAGVEDNLRWRDDYNLDLRLSKNFNVGLGRAQFFVDVSNALGLNTLNTSGDFQGAFVQLNNDWPRYMESLHLPDGTFDELREVTTAPPNLPGNDHPGDYRDPDVAFVPIEEVNQLPDAGVTRTRGREGPIYWLAPGSGDNMGAEGSGFEGDAFYVWDGEGYVEADDGLVNQVLEDKAYIDMPNLRSFTFLNPRAIMFGVRFTY